MADNTQVPGGTGDTIRDKDRAGVKTQIVGLDLGIGTGTESLMSGSIPVTDNGGSLTVDGTVTANAGTGPWPVTDNGGSITVDAPVGTPVRVDPTGTTTQPVSAASLPLPTGAAQEHTTAGSPNSVRLTDGTAFYKATTPADTQPVSLASVPTITEKQDQPASTTSTWTSATAANTAVTVATTGYGTANVSIQVPSTVTAGVITLEVSDDAGTTYYPAGAVRVDNGLQENVIALALTPGIAINRMWSVSVDAMTQVRARLSTAITGSGNVVVRVGVVGGGIEPFVAARVRQVPSYKAVFRGSSRPYRLQATLGAAGRKQLATIHHAASATKTVRIRRVTVQYIGTTAATQVFFDLVRITTAPATGNPAITPGIADNSDAAAEATCLALPTTAGTEVSTIFASLGGDYAITGSASGVNPPPLATVVDLFVATDESKLPTIRAGVLEGWAVTVDMGAATTVNATCMIEFTEEPA